MVHPHPLEHLEEHINVPAHWNEITHSETPFHPKMHPTKLHFTDAHNNKTVEWNSRRHRKGRSLIIKHSDTGEKVTETKDAHRLRGKTFWGWEFKNLSWWVAQTFFWGSISWVINGFAVWLDPLAKTSVGDHLARISAIVGGSIFLIGATLSYFEALNRPPKADKYIPSFYKEHHKASKNAHANSQNPSNKASGDQMSNSTSSLTQSPSSAHLVQSPSASQNLSASVSSLSPSTPSGSLPPVASPPSLSPTLPDSPTPNPSTPPSHHDSSSFDPASSTHDLSESPSQGPTTKGKPDELGVEEDENAKPKFRFIGARWRELGYVAAVSQLIGAHIFYISCVTGMHGVINEDDVAEQQSLYWTPQVVGAMGFVISGMMYMYEVQPTWWQIQPMDLGWQIGFWNWIGAVGFALCGIFGYYAFDGWGQKWGTTFSTFWGGWAFLIGSYIQLYECLNK